MNNFKKWGMIAGIIYLLSLPIAIWKSSKIGKIIFIFFFISLASFAIKTITDAGLTSFYKISLRQKVERVKKAFTIVDDNLDFLKKRVETINGEVTEKVRLGCQERMNRDKSSLTDLESRISEVEKYLSIIKEEERKVIKEKLITIREQIKIFNKSLDSKEIRTEIEAIASNIDLLTPEEKKRLYSDLEELGFGIKGIGENITTIEAYNYQGNLAYGYATASFVQNYAIPTITIQNNIVIEKEKEK